MRIVNRGRRCAAVAFLAAPALAISSAAMAQTVLFSDDFNSDTSALYERIDFNQNRVTFGWDYSALGIPVAPNTTDGSTLGLKMESNMTEGVVAAVTLALKDQVFAASPGYSVQFDMWINFNGPLPDGGAGSTEFATMGVGHDGVTVNRAEVAASGSGKWFAVDGDGGSGIDYRAYDGPTRLLSNVYAAEEWPEPTEEPIRRWSHPYYHETFPGGWGAPELQQQNYFQQFGEVREGRVGFTWVETEIRVQDGVAQWFLNGLLIATLADTPDGLVALGYSDPFASLSDNEDLSFGLFDNLRVVALEDVPPLLPGDANRDGRVDGEDFLIWQAAFGTQEGATWDDGDFNGDGRVDGEDFLIWQAHFGQTASSSAVTPEPAALSLLALAGAGLIRRRRV